MSDDQRFNELVRDLMAKHGYSRRKAETIARAELYGGDLVELD